MKMQMSFYGLQMTAIGCRLVGDEILLCFCTGINRNAEALLSKVRDKTHATADWRKTINRRTKMGRGSAVAPPAIRSPRSNHRCRSASATPLLPF